MLYCIYFMYGQKNLLRLILIKYREHLSIINQSDELLILVVALIKSFQVWIICYKDSFCARVRTSVNLRHLKM